MTRTPAKYNVAIVGAGPAGASAAIRLAKAGLRIALIEQKKFPREKLCGEFVSPECIDHFKELGVKPELRSVGGLDIDRTVFYARSGKAIDVESAWFGGSGSSALGLSRAELDHQLLEKAELYGAEVFRETSAAPLVGRDGVVTGLRLKRLNGADEDLTAELVIDATGRTRSLARSLAATKTKLAPAGFVAFKSHLTGAQIEKGACEIYVYPGGYGGCNQVENGLFNLCFIVSAKDTKRFSSDAEKVMREVVFKNSRAANAMKNIKVVKPWLAVPIERFGRGTLVPANGLITIGDAAAFIDPFTGSGILLALESAKIAAGVIEESFSKGLNFAELTNRYEQKYTAAFSHRLRMCSLLRRAAFSPLLAESVMFGLGLSKTLRRRVAQSTRLHSGTTG
jgi:menaquinone-9 beta-reductase